MTQQPDVTAGGWLWVWVWLGRKQPTVRRVAEQNLIRLVRRQRDRVPMSAGVAGSIQLARIPDRDHATFAVKELDHGDAGSGRVRGELQVPMLRSVGGPVDKGPGRPRLGADDQSPPCGC